MDGHLKGRLDPPTKKLGDGGVAGTFLGKGTLGLFAYLKDRSRPLREVLAVCHVVKDLLGRAVDNHALLLMHNLVLSSFRTITGALCALCQVSMNW